MTIIADIAAEEAVLGTVAMVGEVVTLLHQTGLRPEHFYRHGELYRTVMATHDSGEPIDEITVPGLARFAGGVPAIGNVEAYARRVMFKARWRDRHTAGLVLTEAASLEDESGVAEAERLLIAPEESSRVFRRERLATMMEERLNGTVSQGWKLPFLKQRLTPGTVSLWGGWTSHGKTVWVDQMARALRAQDARVWLWLNEMNADERLCRHASAATGIDLARVLENDLTIPEKARITDAMQSIPFNIVECPGWSGEDIARDIRIRRPDVAIVDILHRIPYENERDLSRLSRLIGDAAKLAGCAVIATVHLNRGRVVAPARPQPTLSDIKGASALEQDADIVGMVWRQDDETTGRPTDVGQIYTLKVRQGRPTGVAVSFDGSTASFEERTDWRAEL